MAACDGEAKGAEPVTTILLNIDFELHESPDCVLMISKSFQKACPNILQKQHIWLFQGWVDLVLWVQTCKQVSNFQWGFRERAHKRIHGP